MRIHCRSNLDDVCTYEEWPTELPFPPRIGDTIQSRTARNNQHLELEVVGCTWKYSDLYKEWKLVVELHLSTYRWNGISDFQEWYKKFRG